MLNVSLSGKFSNIPFDGRKAQSGLGRPSCSQASIMLAIPRPQDSIQPLRKRTLAIPGFCGLERGVSMKSSTLVPMGKWPGLETSTQPKNRGEYHVGFRWRHGDPGKSFAVKAGKEQITLFAVFKRSYEYFTNPRRHYSQVLFYCIRLRMTEDDVLYVE